VFCVGIAKTLHAVLDRGSIASCYLAGEPRSGQALPASSLAVVSDPLSTGQTPAAAGGEEAIYPWPASARRQHSSLGVHPGEADETAS